MLNEKEIKQLEDISDCCQIEITKLTELYDIQTNKYIAKAAKKDASFSNYWDKDNVFGSQAINVIQRYAAKNFNYTENWIE